MIMIILFLILLLPNHNLALDLLDFKPSMRAAFSLSAASGLLFSYFFLNEHIRTEVTILIKGGQVNM